MRKYFKKLPIIIPSIFCICSCIGCGTNNKAYKVFTIQPWFEECKEKTGDDVIKFPEGIKNESECITAIGDYLSNNTPNCTYTSEYQSKDSVIDKNVFTKMGPDQIIIFQGHGNYQSKEVGSVFWNKNFWYDSKLDEDEEFKKDVENGRLVNAQMNEGITGKYIDYYCPDITGSVVYLGQCESGMSTHLVDAFLNKGASCVIANSDVIARYYGDMVCYTTLTLLAKKNEKTNQYYTIFEALNSAKEQYGQSDKYKYPVTGLGAVPMLFGNPNFRLING